LPRYATEVRNFRIDIVFSGILHDATRNPGGGLTKSCFGLTLNILPPNERSGSAVQWFDQVVQHESLPIGLEVFGASFGALLWIPALRAIFRHEARPLVVCETMTL